MEQIHEYVKWQLNEHKAGRIKRKDLGGYAWKLPRKSEDGAPAPLPDYVLEATPLALCDRKKSKDKDKDKDKDKKKDKKKAAKHKDKDKSKDKKKKRSRSPSPDRSAKRPALLPGMNSAAAKGAVLSNNFHEIIVYIIIMQCIYIDALDNLMFLF